MLVILVLVTAKMSAGIGWTTVASLPTNRTAHVAVTAADGMIYAITGYPESFGAPPVLTTANEAYDPATDTWTAKAPIPTARSLPGAAASQNGKIYVIGGYATAVGYSGIVEAYSPTSDSWSGPLSPMPTVRYELAVVSAGQGSQERLYAMGGFHNSPPALSTVEAYDPATNTWATVAPLPEPRRGLAAVRGPDGLVYAIGGTPSVTGQPAATVYAYDPATNNWSTRSPMTTARAYHAAAVGGDGLIYVMGGNFSTPSVEVYNPATDTWSAGPSMPTARSALAAAASLDGRVFTIGGMHGGTKVEALVLPGATVAPPALNFLPQEVGTPSVTLSVTLTSDGTLPLVVSAVGISGLNVADFGIIADSCAGQSFAPGASCVVSVVFNPTAPGSRNASLTLTHNSAVKRHTIPLTGTGVITDTTPPVLTLPADVAVDADSPVGKTVSYVVTAVDPEGAAVSLSCSPPTGSLFPIGTTTVGCTASDIRGNTSTGSFQVRVKGADAQLADLIAAVHNLNLHHGITNSLDAKLANAQAALDAARGGNLAVACNLLNAFINEVQAQTSNKITAAQAAQLVAAANRIKSVLGCP